MRAWAFSDPEVRAVQERVDTRRLESLQRIWSRILDDPAEVHTAALLPYLVGIGASLVQPPTPPHQLRVFTNCCSASYRKRVDTNAVMRLDRITEMLVRQIDLAFR